MKAVHNNINNVIFGECIILSQSLNHAVVQIPRCTVRLKGSLAVMQTCVTADSSCTA